MLELAIAALLLLNSTPPAAPTERAPRHVWVFLKDKGFGDPKTEAAAIGALSETADPRTIERRRLRRTAPGLFDARDLSPDARYLREVEGTGASIRVSSRWLNAVSVRATDSQIARLRLLPFVRGVEEVRGGARRAEPGDAANRTASDDGQGARSFYGYSDAQLNQINVPALHAQGITGQGVIVGILDTGFRTDHVAFHQPGHELQIVAAHDFINNDSNVGPEASDHPDQHVHGTLILGCLASYKPDELVGGAFGASFILCKTEDITSETPIEEDNYVAGLEYIEAHGGDMATASLGYIDWYTQGDMDGVTAVTSIAVNVATQNGLYVCNAAGNEGHDGDTGTNHLIAPADALQVITCGAVDSSGNIAGFSSDGPSVDGRVKPELLARGVETYTIWPYDVGGYAYASGTSLSTPVLACAVACLVQARPGWTVDQMRAMLFASASDQVALGHPDPLFIRGYGILNASAALALDCNANGIADAADISSGASIDTDGDGIPNECEGGGCPSDFDHSGFVDTEDFDAFVRAFEAGNLSCDVDGSGFVDTDDFDAFVHAFEAGC